MKITDEKLMEYGFKKTVTEEAKNNIKVTHIIFSREYNYLFHSKQTLRLARNEVSEYESDLTDGYYILQVGNINLHQQGSILKSQFDDWELLEYVWLGITGEKLKK